MPAGKRDWKGWFSQRVGWHYGLLRVYRVLDVDEKSKQWLADPKNRLCDRAGSWYCPGQYPAAITKPPPTHKAIDYDKHGAGGGTH